MLLWNTTGLLATGTGSPDFDRLDFNRTLRGRVFKVLLESKGIGLSGPSITADGKQWKRCVACERYRSCYDLSVAKPAMAPEARP